MADKTRVQGANYALSVHDRRKQGRIAKGANRSGKSFDGGGFLERPARKDGSSR
jgi:hypothetical protein